MTGVLYLIRHGESVSNAELPSSDPAGIPLTSKGHEQSAQLAQSWSHAPDLIVVSPFVRARQSAMHLCERFPAAPVETWAVQEFVFINFRNASAMTGKERRPLVEAYWQRCDPEEKNPDSESFSEFWERVVNFRRRVARFDGKFIVVFSHGMFMKAFAYGSLHGFGPCSHELMKAVYASQVAEPYVNACG